MHPQSHHPGSTTAHSPMQAAVAEAVRRATTTRGHQSWRVRDVIRGKLWPCTTLEAVIDERIAGGADERDVMAIAYELVRQTRAKLVARQPSALSIAQAYEIEEREQGRAGVAQVRALGSRCAASLKDAWSALVGHRVALDTAIEATEREMVRHESDDAARHALRHTAITRLTS